MSEFEVLEGAGQSVVVKPKAVVKKIPAKAVVKEDMIVSISHSVETGGKEQTLTRVRNLLEEAEMNSFVVGGLLSVIQEQGWWDNGVYKSFREMVEAEYGLMYRKALYLIDIYNGLVASGVAWEDVKSIGWTKLREIVGKITKDNVAEWVERAKSMTVLQLAAYVKALQAPESGGTEQAVEAPVVSTVTTMTFKVHSDQKETIRQALDKAKEMIGTEFDAVALESIALQFLEGALGKKKAAPQPTLEALMAEAGVEGVFTVFEKLFPDVNVTVES